MKAAPGRVKGGPARREDSAAQRLRERAEALTGEAEGPVEAMSPEALRRTLHDLRVHQIELEMQNEELRRLQGELESARERYFDLYDLAPVGYCTLSAAGLILESNFCAARLLGRAREALCRRPLSRFILAEDQEALSVRFAERGLDRFVGIDWHPGATGVPLLGGALARFECATRQTLAAGDHTIILGEVLHAEWQDGAPLLYYASAYYSARPRKRDGQL